MSEEEKIVLDAALTDMLSVRAFRARLDNGHAFVAFTAGAPVAPVGRPGDRVRVEFSPFDMSKGRVLGRSAGEQES